MLRKILGKTLDYFFGSGYKQDYYNIARDYNWAFEDENTRERENFSLVTDEGCKIIIRNIVNLLQAVNIYCAIVNNNPKSLWIIPVLETPRIISILADYENKKRILRKKEEALEDFIYPEHAEQKRNRSDFHLELDDADWWKN